MMLWYRLKHLKNVNLVGVNKYALNFAWPIMAPGRRHAVHANDGSHYKKTKPTTARQKSLYTRETMKETAQRSEVFVLEKM